MLIIFKFACYFYHCFVVFEKLLLNIFVYNFESTGQKLKYDTPNFKLGFPLHNEKKTEVKIQFGYLKIFAQRFELFSGAPDSSVDNSMTSKK